MSIKETRNKALVITIVLLVLLGILYRTFNSSLPFINFGFGTDFSVNFGGGGTFNNLSQNADHKVIDGSSTVSIDANLIGTIDANLISGDLEVRYHDEEYIILDYIKLSDEKDLLYVVDDGILKIETERSIVNFGDRSEGNIIIKIPKDLVLDYNIDNTSGNNELYVDGNVIKIVSVDGNIALIGNILELDIDSVSGNVTVDGKIEKMDVDGTGGDLTLTGTIVKLDADIGGDISFILTDESEKIYIDNLSGDVFVTDQSDGFKLKFYSSTGEIKDNVNNRIFNDEEYQVGNGLIEITMYTASGDFVIEN